MRFKPNVIVCHNETCTFILDSFAEACKRAVSMKYEPTCTSGMEGEHSLASGHYYGRALDFRSRDIEFHLRQNVLHAAQEILGPAYLVLLEDSHYHIQRQHDSFHGPAVPRET